MPSVACCVTHTRLLSLIATESTSPHLTSSNEQNTAVDLLSTAVKGPQLGMATPNTSLAPRAVFLPSSNDGRLDGQPAAPDGKPQIPAQRMQPPFDKTHTIHRIQTSLCHHTPIEIDCQISRGFSMDTDGTWTTDRRGHFTIDCSYRIPGAGMLFLHHSEGDAVPVVPKLIQGIALSLSAEVSGDGPKVVELIQHTSERALQLVPLWPASVENKPKHLWPMFLALKGRGDPRTANTRHAFGRIQFKSATADNRKRHAEQEHCHIKVDLYCDVRPTGDSSPCWIKTAYRKSCKIVIRDPSPSHDRTVGQHNPPPISSGFGKWPEVKTTEPSTLWPVQNSHQIWPWGRQILHFDDLYSGSIYPPQPPPQDDTYAEFEHTPTLGVLKDALVSTSVSLADGSSRPGLWTPASIGDVALILVELLKEVILDNGVLCSLLVAGFVKGADHVEERIGLLLETFTDNLHSERVYSKSILMGPHLKRHRRYRDFALTLALRFTFGAALGGSQGPEQNLAKIRSDMGATLRRGHIDCFTIGEQAQLADHIEDFMLCLRNRNAPNQTSSAEQTDMPTDPLDSSTDQVYTVLAKENTSGLSLTRLDNEDDTSRDESGGKSDGHAFSYEDDVLSANIERERVTASIRNSEALKKFRYDLFDSVVVIERQ
ncbi:p53-like transcription factor [Amniculicola lignicola CBS 123094]|uniref:p53-like transcription factor n=1 Tax=Amniculicola lignicola CBS 123094 TaxID=1392246 RepID=A0A6A5VXU0_9PLEO|nr:p53-like transcription factor [Amniculicola lignicola CBS 123094]